MNKAKIGVCVVVVGCAALMAGAKADAAVPKSTMRSSLQSSAPMVLTTSTGSKNAPTGQMIRVPASTPQADEAGRAQVSSLPRIQYELPRSEQPLPPGVIARSNQIQRMADRLNGQPFSFSFYNNSVIPNTATPRPVFTP